MLYHVYQGTMIMVRAKHIDVSLEVRLSLIDSEALKGGQVRRTWFVQSPELLHRWSVEESSKLHGFQATKVCCARREASLVWWERTKMSSWNSKQAATEIEGLVPQSIVAGMSFSLLGSEGGNPPLCNESDTSFPLHSTVE